MPVWLNLTEDGLVPAFLDPLTMLLSKTSMEADCRLYRNHYLTLDNQVIRFEPAKNELMLLEEKDFLHVALPEEEDQLFTLDAFHDNVLTNDTEVFRAVFNAEHVDELQRLHDWQANDDVAEAERNLIMSSLPKTIGGLYISYM